jgi:hypothetical protein
MSPKKTGTQPRPMTTIKDQDRGPMVTSKTKKPKKTSRGK